MYQPADELACLADELYEKSEDDDFKLAELLRELPKETAIRLCTSNLTNALQVYLYAFNEEPGIEVYEKLLLEPSSSLLYGIKIGSTELAEIIFAFDTKSSLFYVGVWNGEKVLAAYSGEGAYDAAVKFAEENCSA